ncbi:hypothetical protein [Arcobacter sp. L]|uniref:hypothetical protein n=1 Tax=Arcobacter sp. L TaxID=944547 RepID=UPI0002296481|nr:hypothetical protein [Arcobacter sp. L]BAK73737.1 hypothetical protein ABLL_1862 [Arcobacter sp. L]
MNYLIDGEVEEVMVDLEYLLKGYFRVPATKKVNLNPLKEPYGEKILNELYKLAEDHYIVSDTISGLRECLEKL